MSKERKDLWPKDEYKKYKELNSRYAYSRSPVEASTAMISGISGALAVHAGLKALQQGGSAADAAMTASLAQIVLSGGSEISFAGVLNMAYYDAAEGKVYSMNAANNTVQEEKNPMSIPFFGTPSGRGTLVPGFMAGVQAAHDRFGKLPFAKLFEPSIYFAEEGFVLDRVILWWMDPLGTRKKVLSRLPETREIFTKENGEFYREGDLFRQPQLAKTLSKVAEEGADYMYRGEWAKKLVSTLQRDGGKMTLKDLEDYKVLWSDPLKTTYRDYEVCAIDFPTFGGAKAIETFNLLECADFDRSGHYTDSPEELFWFIQIARSHYYLSDDIDMDRLPIDPELVKKYLPEGDFSLKSRVKKETAKLLWSRLREMGGWIPLNQEILKIRRMKAGSTSAVVAVDEEGNVASVCHTINSVGWGTSGIFVDGISIPDSACFQQPQVKRAGPGNRFPEMTNPLIVLKNGKPVLASSCTGVGVHEVTVQNIVNVLDYGMEPQIAEQTPKFGIPVFRDEDMASLENIENRTEYEKQFIGRDFSTEVLEGVRNLGQELEITPPSKGSKASIEGYGRWAGIQIDQKAGKLRGGVHSGLNGLAEGY